MNVNRFYQYVNRTYFDIEFNILSTKNYILSHN